MASNPDVKKRVVINVRGGGARAVYTPHAQRLLERIAGGGPTKIRRASRVEPTAELSDAALLELGERYEIVATDTGVLKTALPQKWWADMHPSKGPVLGPFETQPEALIAELDWLSLHNIPVNTDDERDERKTE